MDFFQGLGVENFANLNLGYAGVIFKVIIMTVLICVPIISVIVAFNLNKKNKKLYRFKVPIFMEVNGKIKRIGQDSAKEIYVPNSNVSLLFLKSKKIYLPRPTRAMGENEFWYKIIENGEWVNFELSKDPEKDTLAIANYDHRDTRYAYTNLKEIIKRNYSDKAIVWWKEYSHVISVIIILVVTVAGLIFLISRIGHVIGQIGPVAESMKEVALTLEKVSINNQNVNSYIAQVK